MQPSRVKIPAQARLFLALPIPPTTASILEQSLQQYPQYIEKVIPTANWHLTMVFLGDVENPMQYLSRLLKLMPQTFMPTISLTYVGRGLQRDQIWAYAHVNPLLTNLRQQLVERLKKMRFPLPADHQREFVPHIHLANMYPLARGVGMADHAINVSFAAQAIHLYHSQPQSDGAHYEILGTIGLTT